MDGGNLVESVSGWETSEACRTEKARINKGEEREMGKEKTDRRQSVYRHTDITDRSKNKETSEIKEQ